MPKPTRPNDRQVMRAEFASIIDLDTLRASNDGKLPTRVPILPKGEFMTLPYGNLVLDDKIFEQMIGNFKAGVRRAVPLDVDHAWENTRAGGWFKELFNEDDGLWGEIDYTKFGEGLVESREYRMISAEWSFDYVDPQKSTHHGAVLVAATLTNRPLMQSMPTITASENNHLTNPGGVVLLLNEKTNTAMATLTDILKKKPEDRDADDLKVLTEKEAELTDDQKAQLEQETKDADAAKEKAEKEEKEKEEAEDEAEEAAEKEDAKACEDALVKAGRNTADAKTEAAKMIADFKAGKEDTTVKASELKRLQKIEADHKASESLKGATEFAQPFIASSKGGKVLPAGKDALITLSQSLNTDQRKLLSTVLASTLDQTITEVEGEDDKAGLTATEKYNKLIAEFMADKDGKPGMSASEANKEVRKAHADVYNAYIATLN